jgi:hypothetical protein
MASLRIGLVIDDDDFVRVPLSDLLEVDRCPPPPGEASVHTGTPPANSTRRVCSQPAGGTSKATSPPSSLYWMTSTVGLSASATSANPLAGDAIQPCLHIADDRLRPFRRTKQLPQRREIIEVLLDRLHLHIDDRDAKLLQRRAEFGLGSGLEHQASGATGATCSGPALRSRIALSPKFGSTKGRKVAGSLNRPPSKPATRSCAAGNVKSAPVTM